MGKRKDKRRANTFVEQANDIAILQGDAMSQKNKMYMYMAAILLSFVGIFKLRK